MLGMHLRGSQRMVAYAMCLLKAGKFTHIGLLKDQKIYHLNRGDCKIQVDFKTGWTMYD